MLSGVIISVLFTSCFKEDDLVAPHQQGYLETGKIVLSETYSNQVFYDLATITNISSNLRDDWDLAFECDKNGWHVILNYAQMMYAGNTKDTNFANITSNSGIKMLFDPSDGNPDNTAIRDWYYTENDTVKSHNYIYVIDRGMGGDYSNLGKKKIQITVDNEKYILRYADLNGDNEHSISITKNDAYKYVYFSFDDDAIVNIAPTKKTWSLQFTKYATMLINDGEDYPYFVTGVLLNPENVSVALDTNDFFNITIQDTSNYQFSNAMDFIGYDWKYYSFDNESYTIVSNQNYIIKNYNGLFYKLRFIDFYDNLGVKGTVSFEVVKL